MMNTSRNISQNISNNPYSRLPSDIINRIAVNRDVAVPRTQEETYLNELDSIYSTWKNKIINTSLSNLGNLSEDEIKFYLANSGANLRDNILNNYNKDKLVTFAQLYISFNNLKTRESLVRRDTYNMYQNPLVVTEDNLFNIFNSGSIVQPQLIQNDLNFGENSIFTNEHPFYDFMLELVFYPHLMIRVIILN